MALDNKPADASRFSKVTGMSWSWWWDASDKQGELLRAVLTVSVALFAPLWLLYTFKKSRKSKAQLPPGPRGLPLLGYLPFLGTQLHKAFTELAKVYGHIYKLWLGNKLCVVVSSPSLAKQIVREHDTVFANRAPTTASQLSSFGGNDIAITSYGPEWKKLRKIFVGKMLGNQSLDACYNLRRKAVMKTIRDVYDKIDQPMSIGDLAFSTSINAIMNMLWGRTLQGEKGANFGSEFRKAMAELMVLMGKPNVSDLFPLLARFDIQGIERQTKKVMSWCEDILNCAIEQRMNLIKAKEEKLGEEQKKDFLQFLLELKEQENTATSITLAQVKGLLMDIVGGGTDTSAGTVEWLMTELMQHPKVLEKVLEELNQVVGLDNMVEEFHLPTLRYLDAVVKETLRVHPPLPLLVPRCPTQSSTVGGYTIPKGTTIFLNVGAIHKDPQLWDNPLEFQPERFVNKCSEFDYMGNNFQYMPFGSGRRVCAGIPLAEKMLMYVVASLLHSFEWKLPHGEELDLSEKFGIVVKKLKPLVVVPTPRLSNLELYSGD